MKKKHVFPSFSAIVCCIWPLLDEFVAFISHLDCNTVIIWCQLLSLSTESKEKPV